MQPIGRWRPARLPQSVSDLLGGSSWLILSSSLSQGSMLLANLVVANLLGVSDFGRYALLQSTIAMLAGIAQLGFAVVIAQQVSSLRERDPDLAGEVAAFCMLVTLALSLLFTAAIMAGRSYLAHSVFRDANLTGGLALAALALPWAAIGSVQLGLFTGLERFREQALLALVLVPAVVLSPAIGALKGGVGGALLGLATAYLLRCAVGQLALMRIFGKLGIKLALRRLRSKLALVGKLALPATLAGLVVLFAVVGGQTMLIRSPGGSATVGLFAAAYLIKTMVMFVPTQMITALLPLLSRHHARGDGDEPRHLLYANVAAAFLLAGALAIVGAILAPWIMAMFGHGFRGGETTLRLLLLAAPIEAATITLYQDIQSRGFFWLSMLLVNVPLAIVVLTAAGFLIPRFGANGLAGSWLIGWTVALCGTLAGIALSRHLHAARRHG